MTETELQSYEVWALLGVLGFAVMAPFLAPRVWIVIHGHSMRACAWMGRRPGTFVICIGILAATVLGLAFVINDAWPEPGVHDEFSYLLAADTFAHGRLTNQTHPYWEYFESFHILHQPTYASKYPPGQGLVLAAGQVVFGDAAYALLLQSAAMCAAIAWMLFGWMTPRWAVLGSLVVLLRFGVTGSWVQSYWGGAVAAIGGALVVGALPRVIRKQRIRHAVVLGSGLGILANSRPYEGSILGLVVAVALLVFLCRNRRRRDLRLGRRVVLPIAGVLMLFVSGMAYYNWQVTGDPLAMPYMLYHGKYEVYPAFFFQPETSIAPLHHPRMIEFAVGFFQDQFEAARRGFNIIKLAWLREVFLGKFFFGWVLLIPLSLLPFVGRRSRLHHCCLGGVAVALALWRIETWWDEELVPGMLHFLFLLVVPLAWLPVFCRRPQMLLPFLVCVAVGLGLSVVTYCQSHYLAPVLGCMILLLVVGWRRMSQLRWIGRPFGAALSVGLMAAMLLVAALRVADTKVRSGFGGERADLRGFLLNKPGRDLVLVSYEDGFTVHREWVYNAADIDAAPIVWARDLSDPTKSAFLRYFADRNVWRLWVSSKRVDCSFKLISRPEPR